MLNVIDVMRSGNGAGQCDFNAGCVAVKAMELLEHHKPLFIYRRDLK